MTTPLACTADNPDSFPADAYSRTATLAPHPDPNHDYLISTTTIDFPDTLFMKLLLLKHLIKLLLMSLFLPSKASYRATGYFGYENTGS